MKRFICIVCALLFAFSNTLAVFIGPVQAENMRILSPPIWMPPNILTDNENTPIDSDDVVFTESDMGFCEPYGTAKKFTSRVDGYSIVIPQDMVADLSLSDICTTFSDAHRTLRIFKETYKTTTDKLSYLSYSNKFIQNTANHTLEKQETFTQNGREYYLLQWSRKKLRRVENDKNYYACIDVCEGARIYTFFFTSDAPFNQCGGYMEIVNSLLTFDPSVPASKAYNKGYKKSDISHLNSAAKATYEELFSENADFKMGMFPPERYGGLPKMKEVEKILDYEFCAFLQYSEFVDKYGVTPQQHLSDINSYMEHLKYYFDYAYQSGKAFEFTLQTPPVRNTESNMVYEILDGEYDQFLEAYAKLIASYPYVTVLFRPFNEMNGDWCTYSAYHTSRDPQIYVELYKYIYGKFKEAGCSNVIWVWNPNKRSYPNFKWNNQSLYYPGDEYVDIYGITGYNNGTYYDSEIWRSFDEIYAPIYERALQINEKPMMITEFSCSSIGGDKVGWLEEMFQSLPKYDKIKVGIWWHSADHNGDQIARPYFMDTPDGMLEVFDKYLN